MSVFFGIGEPNFLVEGSFVLVEIEIKKNMEISYFSPFVGLTSQV